MAMETLMQILQWAVPSGGIGAAIAWIANRRAMQAKTAKSVHDTYKAMYEDVSTLLMETQKKYEETSKLTEELTTENQLTRRAVNRLSRAIEAIQLCPHRAACPVSGELSLDEDDSEADGGSLRGKRRGERGKRGAPKQHRGDKRDATADPDALSRHADVDGKPRPGGQSSEGNEGGIDAPESDADGSRRHHHP